MPIAVIVALLSGVLLTALVTFLIILPRAESHALDREAAHIDRVGGNMLQLIDLQLQSWHELTGTIARQVSERPYEGETIFRSALEFNPTIVQLRVDSPTAPDELTVLNPRYTSPLADPPDSAWIRSRTDSLFAVSWIVHAGVDSVLVATRTPVWIRGRAFRLTTVWDASRFSAMLAGYPIESRCLLSVRHGDDTLWQSRLADTVHTERRIVRTLPSQSGFSIEVAFPIQPTTTEARESALSTTGIVLALAIGLWVAGWWWLPRRHLR